MKKGRSAPVKKMHRKPLIIVILVQSIIILFFLLAFRAARQIEVSETTQTSFVVEDTEYWSGRGGRSSRFYLVSNSATYRIPTHFNISEYREGKIAVGDSVSLRYINTWVGMCRENLIVEAELDDEQLFSLEDFNDKQQQSRNATIVLFSIIEFIWLSACILYFVFIAKLFKHKR